MGECSYAVCHYAECQYAECVMLSVVMLSVVMLSVVAQKIRLGLRECLRGNYNNFSLVRTLKTRA
jgi:hypothetical protein